MKFEKDRVIIVGAGPVGMVCALGLNRAGIKVTVLELEPAPVEDQRAASLHPPTVEMLDRLGIAGDIIPLGLVSSKYHFRDRVSGELIAEFDLSSLKDEVPFPYVLQYEQYKLTHDISQKFADESDFDVRFSRRVTDIRILDDRVEVEAQGPAGKETFVAGWLVGADGGRSTVRHAADIEFEGFTYPERFLVVSTAFEYADHLPKLSYVNYCSDPKEWCVLLRVPTLWRVLFPTKVEETDDEVMGDASVQRRLQGLLPQPVPYQTVHRTLYKVHQRVAKNFRHGRVLLAGDSAHINNPLGGMGMNGGVHDAMNLCQKLLGVIQQGHSTDVLDRYERQRRSIAIEYINASTARNKKEIEERDPVARQKTQDELRAIAADPKAAKAYIRKTSMLDALERAEAIA